MAWQKNTKDFFHSPASANLKNGFFVGALAFFSIFLVINWLFLDTLKNKFREVTDKEAKLYTLAISENLSNKEFNWVFTEILQKSDFPIIITDRQGNPQSWRNIHRGFWEPKGNPFDMTQSFQQLTKADQDYLIKIRKRFSKERSPLNILESKRFYGYFYYGDPPFIALLSWMPLFELIAFIVFLFIIFIGTQTVRTGEQSLLWVALAKETAHQMGTPLSSLLGWVELLRYRMQGVPENEKNIQTLSEINADVMRLKRVSERFSKIGSLPQLSKQSLNTLCENTVEYFETRLPQLDKKVDLHFQKGDLPELWVNDELIGWVLENLIKNALDSIHEKKGYIHLETFYSETEQTAYLTVTDSGKGIRKENLKKVFQTGYSTKKRGWGLGLSLVKRIIKEYHNGNVFVEWSSRHHGTRFQIQFPLIPNIIKKEIHDKWKKTNSMGR
jgi:signal transduction histidine kinase